LTRPKEEAHSLLDAVPEDRLTDAIDMLRQWASPEPGDIPRRQFRTTAIFDGEHDLGARAKQIVRDASRREARVAGSLA
jgi:hypothetical protein